MRLGVYRWLGCFLGRSCGSHSLVASGVEAPAAAAAAAAGVVAADVAAAAAAPGGSDLRYLAPGMRCIGCCSC